MTHPRPRSLLRTRLRTPPPPTRDSVRPGELLGVAMALLLVLLVLGALWAVTP
jgi:hypothetical protein